MGKPEGAADQSMPAWRRRTQGEPRWPASLAVVLAAALQISLPARLTLQPRFLLPALELLLLVGLIIANPVNFTREGRFLRAASITLIGVISASNAWIIVREVELLVAGKEHDAVRLLTTGAGVWVVNVLLFALWYWELDRGGPAARTHGVECYPDFLFPQMSSPDLAHPDWEPIFVDYLYVSFTNATAFSPTDVMPLSRSAKVAMALQSTVALVTLALVIARAINVLKQ